MEAQHRICIHEESSSNSNKKSECQELNFNYPLRPKLLIQFKKEGIKSSESKIAKIVKKLNSPGHLYALEFLLENPIGCITSECVLIDALFALTTSEKPSILELHVRTLIAIKDDLYCWYTLSKELHYLLIHLRDTFHSLRDDETRLEEIWRLIKELLKHFINWTRHSD
ncbi:20693_t:CDS:2 [Gigaspora rosea]|nr:20693_t:CDS:2 [Gigaspora rosea]